MTQTYPTVEEALKEFPNHGRTSCSDENPCNYYTTPGRGGFPRCSRCALLMNQKDPEKYPIMNLSMVKTLYVQVEDTDD